MDINEAINQRRSIRGFLPQPIDRAVIGEILETASRSPSGKNAQPWEFTVVSGEPLFSIAWGNVDRFSSGVHYNMDVDFKLPTGKYHRRAVNVAIELFTLMEIPRGDREKRYEWEQRGYRYFDAPAVIFISVDRSLDLHTALFDVGLVTQTICLSALAHGLGTCISIQGIHYPDVIRQFTAIPESKLIVIAIALGYPDADYPANRARSQRVPIEDNTAWIGFSDSSGEKS